ncbi:hypothetical protein OEV82_10475 [Caldibacillus thermolactis]|uniref:Uncharacterized protein n=1 Tax=Pallidibacillus thermolactis TaxID=251051 RepID=A0ABT2WGP2_9BACI|nr:hypothetical protein [Pallidibacillus thermolactis]MCU9594861.1 hypothetical protein [Pallidibacillus thermolactis]MCU9602452.1 hypothetical protein [Pallidibacillus thermolactis subsp. kokeshiiformis]MED1674024.1 hypothetical protein [Pallidibacillus thermolactis subsp. kokeshiiformis]
MNFELKWALIILFVILLSFFVPFTLLTNLATWNGSFLFWILMTIVVIVSNYYFTKDWGK